MGVNYDGPLCHFTARVIHTYNRGSASRDCWHCHIVQLKHGYVMPKRGHRLSPAHTCTLAVSENIRAKSIITTEKFHYVNGYLVLGQRHDLPRGLHLWRPSNYGKCGISMSFFNIQHDCLNRVKYPGRFCYPPESQIRHATGVGGWCGFLQLLFPVHYVRTWKRTIHLCKTRQI